jgi:hypothetical protein
MEIKSRYQSVKMICRTIMCMLLMLFVFNKGLCQPPLHYSVRDGKMYIMMGKDVKLSEINDFVKKFDLGSLALDRFLTKGFTDSLFKAGWKIEKNDKSIIEISKSMSSFDQINNPADRILFNDKNVPVNVLFPSVSSTARFGYNRFRSGSSFTIRDSVVQFYLRGYAAARTVMLAGSFNGWNPSTLPMTKTDSGWVFGMKLHPGKYWYKFIVNGNWMTDPDNKNSENDGLGNTNSVYYYPNKTFRLDGYLSAKKVILAGSFNNWNESQVQMERDASGWHAETYLGDGTYTYRYIVDNKWMDDSTNPNKLPNEFGEYNSVVTLGNPYIFRLTGYDNAKHVILTGSFNGWRKDELRMMKTSTGWEYPYVLGPGNYQYRFVVDGKEMIDPGNPPATKNTRANSILILQPNYTFHLKGHANAKDVFLAGDFNEWSPNTFAMRYEDGEWILSVNLSPGKHLYKFIVDGNWMLDPANKLWEKNEHNTGNSVMWLE